MRCSVRAVRREGSGIRAERLSLRRQAPMDLSAPPDPSLARQDFAARVVRTLVNEGDARIAVIDNDGKAAMVRCSERLFDVLAQDHPIVGVYKFGVRVRDVMEDLKAAGL